MDNKISMNIESWKNHVDEVQDILKTIASDSECRMVLGDSFCETAREWNRKIGENRHIPYTIVVCGEFKRGKSSLINALLGENIVPVDVLPETVTVNTICYGEHRNEAVLKNGKRLLLEDEEIHRDNLQKINRDYDGKITHLILYRPIELLHEINIIDTPGLNEATGLQEELTKQVVGMADAVIYTFVPNSPLSMTEQLFLRTSILVRTGIDLFLVCNKMDMIEEDEQDTFRVWMNNRVNDMLKDIKLYYVSALDTICARESSQRPNIDIVELLEKEMDELKYDLKRLVSERSEMATPNRVNYIIETMKNDIEQTLSLMEEGAAMSESNVRQAEEKMNSECIFYKNKLLMLQSKVDAMIDQAMENTAGWMNDALEMMKKDTGMLENVQESDLIRYYPFFCMDKLQDSLDLCFFYEFSKITEVLLNECGQNSIQILEQRTNPSLKITFNIDNQTWTKGDNISFIGKQFNLGFFTYVIDGIAGVIRNKELNGKKRDVLGQIIAQYDGLKEEVSETVVMVYKKLKEELNTNLNLYFQNKILSTQDKMEKAKEIAALGSKRKEQIYASVTYVRQLMRNIL